MIDDIYDVLNEVLTVYIYIPLESAAFELLCTRVSGYLCLGGHPELLWGEISLGCIFTHFHDMMDDALFEDYLWSPLAHKSSFFD